jgi:anti-sigma regulatory factor (Ser/Thr protein kinase)
MSDMIELSPTADSVAAARRWSAGILGRWGAVDLSDTMSLLVSELVSNVVLHARTPCSLSIVRAQDRIRVEVQDGSDRLPGISPETDPLAQSGRGMQLVVGLSDRHGVDLRPEGGKLVWFELLLPTAE